MKPAEAQMLVAKLAAAFPRDWSYAGAATNAVYVERLQRLPVYEAARDAVDALIDGETRLPSVAKIRDEYRRYTDRYKPKELPAPEITDAEREANRERAAALAASLTRRIDSDDRRTRQDTT